MALLLEEPLTGLEAGLRSGGDGTNGRIQSESEVGRGSGCSTMAASSAWKETM
jgi:hypothetical protein